jgi:hypothetical protein
MYKPGGGRGPKREQEEPDLDLGGSFQGIGALPDVSQQWRYITKTLAALCEAIGGGNGWQFDLRPAASSCAAGWAGLNACQPQSSLRYLI